MEVRTAGHLDGGSAHEPAIRFLKKRVTGAATPFQIRDHKGARSALISMRLGGNSMWHSDSPFKAKAAPMISPRLLSTICDLERSDAVRLDGRAVDREVAETPSIDQRQHGSIDMSECRLPT